MALRSLSLACLRIPFVESFAHSTHARRTSDAVLVRAEADDGTIGYGEGLPRPYVSGETVDSVVTHVSERLWPRLRGSELPDGSNPGDVVAAVGALLGADAAASENGIVAHTAARCAVELALVDCALRRAGQSLSAALPDSGAAPPYSGVITTGSTERALELARMMSRIGLTHIKVKVGDDSGVERVAALREQLGAGVSIRVDANGVWTLQQALRELEALARFGVASCEEPLGRDRMADLPELRRKSPVPIMVDESLVTLDDGRHLADTGGCDIFNVRLSKCGGIGPALELVTLARQRGLGVQLGCHVGETSVLAAAGRHVGASIDGLLHLEGAYGTLLLAEDIASPSVRFGHRGAAPALRGPGLGMSVVEDRVERYCERKVVLT